MKKILLVFTLIFLFSLTGCKTKEQRALEDFFEASSLQADISFEVKQNKNYAEITFCNFSISEESLSMHIYEIDTTISFDLEDSIIYYQKGNNKFYSNIEENGAGAIPLSNKADDTEDEDIDIMEYVLDPEYSKNTFSFELDFEGILIDNLTKQEYDAILNEINLDTINCYGVVEKGKVISFSINFLDMISLYDSSVYSSEDELIITLENIQYDDVDPLEDIQKSSYTFIDSNQLINIIYQDLNLDLDNGNNNVNNGEGGIPQTPTYRIEFFDIFYTINPGETFDLKGNFVVNDEKFISFEECQITYSPELNLDVVGFTEHIVTVTYKGISLNRSIYVNVIGEKKTEGLIDVFESCITKSFQLENYLLLSDTTSIYKYNIITNEIEGSVDLKCQANSIYVKGEYVYVAANYSGFDFGIQKGTISKIKLSDFTLEKQLELDFYPCSIFVDKRDKVGFIKGQGQFFIYSFIDLETKEVTEITLGYEKDVLVYSEERDAFMAVSTQTTAPNEWYKYNGVTYELINDKNEQLSDIDFMTSNGKVLIHVKPWMNEVTVAKYQKGINDYTFVKHTIPTLDFYVDYCNATYYEEKIYIILSTSSGNQSLLVEIDLKTNAKKSYIVEVLDANIESIHCYKDKLYICYYDGSVLDVVPLS